MYATYIVYNIVPVGFVMLLVYMFIDIILDFFRTSKRSIVKRGLLYSFLFYSLSLIQIKFGGITYPPQNPDDSGRSFFPTGDWFGIFDTIHFNISLWGFTAILYNVLLLIPFGIYLSILFNVKSIKKAISIVFLTCMGVELIHLLFAKFGLVVGGVNILSLIYLELNILGGILGFLFVALTTKIINSYKATSKIKANVSS